MLFFYIRHGDPIYKPDSLTALGEKQADALAKRLALYGLDKIYSSTSTRAINTAKPTCDLLKKDMELLDFANENHAWEEFTVERNGKRRWLYMDDETKLFFEDESIASLGRNWCEHPEMLTHKRGVDRISNETFNFFKSLGYERIKNTAKYKVLKPNNERIALFAHHGFGLAFLSEILSIPYPILANHFDMCCTGMTVIEFEEKETIAIPRILTYSSDSHLYREGIPTKYNNKLYF